MALGVPALVAQQPVVVAGRVVRVTPRGEEPVAGAFVTLHRIGAASAGPVDSAMTGMGGSYRFRIAAPDTSAMYLATARHGGIAYFAPPVRADDDGGLGEIQVFDTSSAPIRLGVGGRHLVVSAPDADGGREVLEVYELQNDTVITRVGTRERPAFVAALPADAANPRARQGDFTGDAVVFDARSARVIAPVVPGVRQLAIAYTLPAAAFPLVVDVTDSTGVFEVLLEEPTATVTGDSLQRLGAVTSEGRSFVRYLGRNLPAGRRVGIEVPRAGGSGSSWVWLAGLGLASLGAIAWSLRLRRIPAAVAAPGPPGRGARARELRAAIGGVDGVLAHPDTTPASHESLRAYRAQLQHELDALLAADAGPE
ncbi:MAG: hypothetical protein ACT4P7_03500 [Gemmatimonadaceae bacterium]